MLPERTVTVHSPCTRSLSSGSLLSWLTAGHRASVSLLYRVLSSSCPIIQIWGLLSFKWLAQ